MITIHLIRYKLCHPCSSVALLPGPVRHGAVLGRHGGGRVAGLLQRGHPQDDGRPHPGGPHPDRPPRRLLDRQSLLRREHPGLSGGWLHPPGAGGQTVFPGGLPGGGPHLDHGGHQPPSGGHPGSKVRQGSSLGLDPGTRELGPWSKVEMEPEPRD